MLNEKLSAWVDGELDEAEAEQVMRSVLMKPDWRQACDTAFRVGDVLRAEPAVSNDFASRVMAALEQEPVVLAPARMPRREAANDAAPPRWMALAASVAGVAFVGWLALSQSGGESQSGNAVMASKAPQPAASLLVRAPRNDDEAYVMAHQASAAGTPVPGMSAFVRTVSAEQVGPAR